MNELLKLPNKLRREFMKLLDNDYIKKKLQKRKGLCKKCGQCCKGCKHLGKDNLCKTYDNRPWTCYKDFPLDNLDKKIWQVRNCGYSFEE
jgi:hypothetical protein